jgi:hypothetical protein
MKQFCIFVLCLSLLTATSMLMPSASEAMTFKWKSITPDRSAIRLEMDGYKTRYEGTGWNDSYTREAFRAQIESIEKPLSISFTALVLGPGRIWNHTLVTPENIVRTYSKFKNSIVDFALVTGAARAGSFDGKKGGKSAMVRFELNHSVFKYCYFMQHIPYWGMSADFNPAIYIEICTKEDLKLSSDGLEKFFILDNGNEKVTLDLNNQNLGRKITRRKSQSNSTNEHGDGIKGQRRINNESKTEKQLINEQLLRLREECIYGNLDSCYLVNKMVEISRSNVKTEFEATPKHSPKRESGTGSFTDRLKALKKLEDAGLVSKEEAAAKRKDILKNL